MYGGEAPDIRTSGRARRMPTVWAHGFPIRGICALFLYVPERGTLRNRNMRRKRSMKKVGIVMGSDSDLPVVRKAADTLEALHIPYEMHIFSAHRTPDEAAAFAANARRNGFGVLIAAAGMAAHLAGALAARTTLPVIGIPCKSSCFDGMDALLSTVQMPGGIPVATVAVNGAVNAALLSAEILAVGDPELAAALDERRAREAAAVLEKDAALQSGTQPQG